MYFKPYYYQKETLDCYHLKNIYIFIENKRNDNILERRKTSVLLHESYFYPHWLFWFWGLSTQDPFNSVSVKTKKSMKVDFSLKKWSTKIDRFHGPAPFIYLFIVNGHQQFEIELPACDVTGLCSKIIFY